MKDTSTRKMNYHFKEGSVNIARKKESQHALQRIERSIFTFPSTSLITNGLLVSKQNRVNDIMATYPNEKRDINFVIDVLSIKKTKLRDSSSGKFIGYSGYGNIDYGDLKMVVQKNENNIAT